MSTLSSSPSRWVTTRDGVRLAVYDCPGDQEVVVFLSHATGFNGLVWYPVLDQLPSASVSWDLRNHGRSDITGFPTSWWESAWDAAEVLDATSGHPRLGVGHSFGGSLLAMAWLEQSSRLDGLVLIEPIILPSLFRRTPEHIYAQLAQRRRNQFESVEAARENFVSKLPFSRWHPQALEGYLTGGLTPDPEGETERAVRLSCPPEQETEIYTAAGLTGLVDFVEEIRIPCHLMIGAESDAYPPGWAGELAAKFDQVELEVVEGHSHFLPMENPQRVLAAIERMGRKLIGV